ncbi:hypothetical protein SESBI_50952 [Sesbania bispinosa]|nr:hypothetical protein SESBI_50952 [Sesbania bispinosa]
MTVVKTSLLSRPTLPHPHTLSHSDLRLRLVSGGCLCSVPTVLGRLRVRAPSSPPSLCGFKPWLYDVVVSEEHGWVFMGIYNGFNGLDAPEYLLSNLYTVVHKELKGLLWDNGSVPENSNLEVRDSIPIGDVHVDVVGKEDKLGDACSQCVEQESNNRGSQSKFLSAYQGSQYKCGRRTPQNKKGAP